jgi:hypothetical protein
LHLQVLESFFDTFLIVISLTSFQHPAGIALEIIGLKYPALGSGPVTATSPAGLNLRAVASQLFQWNSGDPFPARPKTLFDHPDHFLAEEAAFCNPTIRQYSTKVSTTGSIIF